MIYFDDIQLGEKYVSRGRTITEADIVGFAGLTGDWYELHVNKEVAKNSPFGERIAHGMLVLSIATGLITPYDKALIAFYGMDKVRFVGDPVAFVVAETLAQARDAAEAVELDIEPLQAVIDEHPDVLNHNVETVPRLYPLVRPQAVYERSLELLGRVAEWGKDTRSLLCEAPGGPFRQKTPGVFSPLPKSGLMVGLGETHDEVAAAMRDLRAAGCEALTIGQYLRPSPEHLPVERFVPPEEFEAYQQEAKALGFSAVAAGPFVRSSYHADELLADVSRG